MTFVIENSLSTINQQVPFLDIIKMLNLLIKPDEENIRISSKYFKMLAELTPRVTIDEGFAIEETQSVKYIKIG